MGYQRVMIMLATFQIALMTVVKMDVRTYLEQPQEQENTL